MNEKINLEYVIDYLQKQTGESEVIKFALDAAIRAAVNRHQAEYIEQLEQAIGAKDNELERGGANSNGNQPEPIAPDGVRDTNGQSGRSELVRGASQG